MITGTFSAIWPRASILAAVVAGLMAFSTSLRASPFAVTEFEAQPTDPVSASPDGIEAVLGRLQTNQEALLREPLLAMRRAEMEFQALPNAQYEHQLSWWAQRFSERLTEREIPEGARYALAMRIAAYEHAALLRMEAILAARHDPAAQGAALLAEKAGTEDVNRALTTPTAEMAAPGWFDWTVAGAFLIAVLAAAALFGSHAPSSDPEAIRRGKKYMRRNAAPARSETWMRPAG